MKYKINFKKTLDKNHEEYNMDTSDLKGFRPLPSNSQLLHTWKITDETSVRLRHGSAGFVLAHCAFRFDRKIEDIDRNYRNGALDDWGYAFRPVRGYAELSRHAYGLAVDLNATDHPLGQDHTFTPGEIKQVRFALAKYDDVIRWGGDYSGRKDAMHFEIDDTLAEVEKVARRLADSKVGEYLLKRNPGQRDVIFS